MRSFVWFLLQITIPNFEGRCSAQDPSAAESIDSLSRFASQARTIGEILMNQQKNARGTDLDANGPS
jgi:hypothetical protein